MYCIDHKPDVGSVLSNLDGIIRKFDVQANQYLRHLGAHEVINPFRVGPGSSHIRMRESLPDGFWEKLGIRRLTLDHIHSKPFAADSRYGGESTVFGRWNRIKNEALIKELSHLFANCSLIEFGDWVELDDASGFWDGIYSDVIKPLQKKDFQFIFHLGDTARKGVFEIDEVLDIIGDYSSFGKVTLMLDNHEADNLWCRLNGRNPAGAVNGFGSQPAKEKHLSLFNTMSIDSLVVFYGHRSTQFSRDGQVQLTGRSPLSIREVANARGRFSAGYQLGLLLGLDPTHCIALGLAVSGAGHSSGAGSVQVLQYIQDWQNNF